MIRILRNYTPTVKRFFLLLNKNINSDNVRISQLNLWILMTVVSANERCLEYYMDTFGLSRKRNFALLNLVCLKTVRKEGGLVKVLEQLKKIKLGHDFGRGKVFYLENNLIKESTELKPFVFQLNDNKSDYFVLDKMQNPFETLFLVNLSKEEPRIKKSLKTIKKESMTQSSLFRTLGNPNSGNKDRSSLLKYKANTKQKYGFNSAMFSTKRSINDSTRSKNLYQSNMYASKPHRNNRSIMSSANPNKNVKSHLYSSNLYHRNSEKKETKNNIRNVYQSANRSSMIKSVNLSSTFNQFGKTPINNRISTIQCERNPLSSKLNRNMSK